MATRCAVDWLSLTWPCPDTADARSRGQVITALVDFARVWSNNLGAPSLELAAHRYPYTAALQDAAAGIKIFGGHGREELLIEISGKGCDHLREAGTLEHIIAIAQNRLTRIDLAADILTDTEPAEFANDRPVGRFRRWSYDSSDTGKTYYVGSKTSDRYARVYRYHEPHPRSAMLRVEHVFRQQQAKTVGALTSRIGVDRATRRAGAIFGWQHPVWDVHDEEPIPAWRPERRRANTVRWFYKAVVPALHSLIDDDVLSEQEILSAITSREKHTKEIG